jgi:hypothetical protein
MADIVVKRVEGAAVNEAFQITPLKIGVIGRSRGTSTDDTASYVHVTLNGSDAFPTTDTDGDTIPNVRSVTRIHNLQVGQTDVYYYPNQHFTIEDDSGNILDPSKLGTDGDTVADLNIDWSHSTALLPPSLTSGAAVVSGSGNALEAGIYYYYVSAVDLNAVETPPGGQYGPITVPASGLTTYVNSLSWERIHYSDGYVLYRSFTPVSGGSAVVMSRVVSDKDTITFIDADYLTGWSVGSPETVNLTKIEPQTSEASGCTVEFKYGAINYNTYEEFTSYDQVLSAHGVGSELANVARLYMQAQFNGCPIIATVVPNGTNATAYQVAANEFSKYHVQFIVMLYAGSTDITAYSQYWKPIYDLAANLSDEETGQMECYAVTSLPYAAGRVVKNVETFIDGYQSTGTKGKRGYVVIPDGFKLTAASWQSEDGSYDEDYTVTDPANVDITPIVFAGAAIARYTGMQDVAEPLTEKDVAGFYFKNAPFTKTQLDQLVEYGAMPIRNDSTVAVCQRSINMSLPILSLEDGELSICTTEDWMRKDLRNAIKKYRGKKMISPNILAASRTLTTKLEQYENNGIIAWFDRSSVSCRQDSVEKDKLVGYFEFMPIYPLNKIDITYSFSFTVI